MKAEISDDILTLKKIKVGPYEYKIVHGPTQANEDGLCTPNKLTIHIALHAEKSRAVNTILHESIHALWDVFNLDDPVGEEAAVTAIANGVQMLLKDNPKLLKLLSE